ncbi:hypothetical protein [Streptacidiphilus jiangxiensis]|uniref:PRC-barrel domain-containing protein n=1 Tax=Streptacidiphilus jiangxiensis TaxID=235985 RepID=A0A1H7ZBS0_STRJI|nr:hypothetical protein [Streptacidiphilus jiangxiensis]SEM55705.1 hypothetical protein SAMN05414137_13411 [Streptacidiphilus jiangxiensis]
MSHRLWSYPSDSAVVAGEDVTGYRVEAADGPVGHVEAVLDRDERRCLIVDTGTWILGRRVVVPAGTVARVDCAAKAVHVALTRDQIKGAPAFERDDDFWTTLGRYYGAFPGFGPML